ncbi:MAG: sensor histidine kinase [Desulfosudaceae bacterium]
MNNIVRHSGADQVYIAKSPSHDNGLRLFIADTGRGFDADASLEAETENRVGGFGLMNMKERAFFTGGNFDIRSTPRQGTTLDIVWSNRFLTEEGDK